MQINTQPQYNTPSFTAMKIIGGKKDIVAQIHKKINQKGFKIYLESLKLKSPDKIFSINDMFLSPSIKKDQDVFLLIGTNEHSKAITDYFRALINNDARLANRNTKINPFWYSLKGQEKRAEISSFFETMQKVTDVNIGNNIEVLKAEKVAEALKYDLFDVRELNYKV